jgi:hypothetical protein
LRAALRPELERSIRPLMMVLSINRGLIEFGLCLAQQFFGARCVAAKIAVIA